MSDTLVKQFNVPAKKINSSRYFNNADILSCIRALEGFRKLCDIFGMTGSIAEVGVFQGDFAKHINRLFPDTATGEKDTYIFVNLDADLYAPTLAGLKHFYPKMCTGGVIFVHDFFSPVDTGVKRAVIEFARSHGIGISPVGDFLTISITKSS